MRGASVLLPPGAAAHTGFDLGATTSWGPVLDGCQAVVHTAARVHVMRDRARDPLSEYRRVNVDGTVRLAEQAKSAGVRRFVFLSTIKVLGERTDSGHPFTSADAPNPGDAYAVSKAEAEAALLKMGQRQAFEVAIIRPVLVYGPGVKGNFRQLLALMHRGIPLPFGSVSNSRSFVALANLVDLIHRCIEHPGAANSVFLVRDPEDLSTTELLRRIARALGRRARLVPFPTPLLRAAAGAVGMGTVAQRLLDSLQVDDAPTRALLSWTPPHSVDEELRRTAAWFLATA